MDRHSSQSALLLEAPFLCRRGAGHVVLGARAVAAAISISKHNPRASRPDNRHGACCVQSGKGSSPHLLPRALRSSSRSTTTARSLPLQRPEMDSDCSACYFAWSPLQDLVGIFLVLL